MRNDHFLNSVLVEIDEYLEVRMRNRGHLATIHTIYKACCAIQNAADRERVAKIATDILDLKRNPDWDMAVSGDIIAQLYRWTYRDY